MCLKPFGVPYCSNVCCSIFTPFKSSLRHRAVICIFATPDVSVQPYYCGVEAPETSEGGGDSRSTKYLMFGHSMTDSFECDLSTLLVEEAFFYDPYILDEVCVCE